MGKFMDSFKQHQRGVRKSRGRRKQLNAYPWHDGLSTQIVVMNAIDPGEKKTTDIIDVQKGHSVGLMFEQAGKLIITEISCPACKGSAKLNVHWPAFKCPTCNTMWEQYKHEQI